MFAGAGGAGGAAAVSFFVGSALSEGTAASTTSSSTAVESLPTGGCDSVAAFAAGLVVRRGFRPLPLCEDAGVSVASADFFAGACAFVAPPRALSPGVFCAGAESRGLAKSGLFGLMDTSRKSLTRV